MQHCQQLKWYQNRVIWIVTTTVIVLILSGIIEQLAPLRLHFMTLWQTIWWAVGLGLLISGLIDTFIPDNVIQSLFQSSRKHTIWQAAVLGTLFATCSHGILAISMTIYKKGASASTVITFLLASPWANPAITILLFSLFGLSALWFICFALIIAIITGHCYRFAENQQWLPTNPYAIPTAPITLAEAARQIKKHMQHQTQHPMACLNKVINGTLKSANMVLAWILFGTWVGAALSSYVPHHVFHQYLGADTWGLLGTLGLATIIEICSEGSAPIAASIYEQTQAFGNVFIFLMAGVITDYTELGLIWQNINKKSAMLLPILTLPLALSIAAFLNGYV